MLDMVVFARPLTPALFRREREKAGGVPVPYASALATGRALLDPGAAPGR